MNSRVQEHERLRLLHVEQFAEALPLHLARLNWSAQALKAERTHRLRKLLATAKNLSPWHRDRLRQIDVSRASEEDLRFLPPMTKIDLMENFDEILTVRDLSREQIERHIASLDDDGYLEGGYHAVASSGSSGERGVFVYDWDAWLTCALVQSRFRARFFAESGLEPGAPRVIVAGDNATHMGYAMASTFTSAAHTSHLLPASLPMDVLVERLNGIQPVVLSGLPSMVSLLANEAVWGRLHIAPSVVTCTSEPLLPEMRQRISAAWGVAPQNSYFTSEGASASECGAGYGMHLNEDLCVFEPVDEDGRPVPPGEHAAKLYVTPLFNLTQPLVRYELSDQIKVLHVQCPCGSGMRLIGDIGGRGDDIFFYPGGVVVHPIVFASPLARDRLVLEYRVSQTVDGAAVQVVAPGILDREALRASLEAALGALLPEAKVTLEVVPMLARLSSGKLKRYVPLPGVRKAREALAS
jgi:phenylacetate-CoA ligase